MSRNTDGVVTVSLMFINMDGMFFINYGHKGHRINALNLKDR